MRIPALDAFSGICIFCVVCMHSLALQAGEFSNWKILDINVVSLLITQVGRFAIPFFLLALGFYYGKALQRGVNPFSFLVLIGSKLLYIFFSWSLIYAVIPPDFISKFIKFGILSSIYTQLMHIFHSVTKDKLSFFIYGTAYHLWFITGCMWSLTITSFFCKFRIEKFLIPFGALLYLIGMLTKYPIGLPLHPDLIDSLHSPIFVAVGRWFSMYHEKNKKLALALFFGGAMMHFAEIILLKEMYNYSASNIKDISFLLGTFLWGIGAFLLCLEYPNAGKDTILERIGKLTLGIYVSHILIIWALMPFSALFKSLVWEIFKPVPALLISYCLCQGIARNRIFGKFLT